MNGAKNFLLATGFALAAASCGTDSKLSESLNLPATILFEGDKPAAYRVTNMEEAYAKFPDVKPEEFTKAAFTQELTGNAAIIICPCKYDPITKILSEKKESVFLFPVTDTEWVAVHRETLERLLENGRKIQATYPHLYPPEFLENIMLVSGETNAAALPRTEQRICGFSLELMAMMTKRELDVVSYHEFGHLGGHNPEPEADSCGVRPDPKGMIARDYAAQMSFNLSMIRAKWPENAKEAHGLHRDRIIHAVELLAQDTVLPPQQRRAQERDMRKVNEEMQKLQQTEGYESWFPKKKNLNLLEIYDKEKARMQSYGARKEKREHPSRISENSGIQGAQGRFTTAHFRGKNPGFSRG
jgi:hypothetical protein